MSQQQLPETWVLVPGYFLGGTVPSEIGYFAPIHEEYETSSRTFATFKYSTLSTSSSRAVAGTAGIGFATNLVVRR